MKTIILSLACLAIAGCIGAQSQYHRAVGVRISSHIDYATVAASYKFYISGPGAIELNAGFGRRNRYSIYDAKYWYTTGISLAGSYQHHFKITAVDGLKWFVGGGLLVFNSFSKQNYYDGFGAVSLAQGVSTTSFRPHR